MNLPEIKLDERNIEDINLCKHCQTEMDERVTSPLCIECELAFEEEEN